MTLKELILQLVRIAIYFAFPTIWNWLMQYVPWWPLDPETTLGLIISLAVTLVSWVLGYLGIRKVIQTLRVKGLVAE